jgi:hypothetical protein
LPFGFCWRATDFFVGVGFIVTSDHEGALRSALQANIDRYRGLLRTNLTELEQDFIKRRLAEEQARLQQFGEEITSPQVVSG